MEGLVIDNFAGGGGASTGIEAALGRPVDVAINHDEIAVAMHRVNHPNTKHYCESVWSVDPVEVCAGRPVGLVWFSPDCSHFSKAKGGKPVKKHIRGLAWVALKWAATVRPQVIMLENVEEFATWGPLLRDEDGNYHPCPKRKGQTFNAFINALKRQGYAVQKRELRACNYGSPTIRKRLFIVARCDGQPIVWPEPTHGDPNSEAVMSGRLAPWRTAAECIDWTIPCPSIFKRKKPLVEATQLRIAKGIMRYVISNPEPFIVTYCGDKSGEFRGQAVNEPLRTQTTGNRHGIVLAFLLRYFGQSVGSSPDDPIGTVTPGGLGKTCLVTSHMVKLRGTCRDGQPIDKPMPTVTAGGLHIGEVRTFLQKYYGTDQDLQLNKPLYTVTTKDRFGLVTVRGEEYQIVDIGMRMLSPRELYRAQGFPDYYIIDLDSDGKRITKTEQVKKCGNSVPPHLAEALVRVNVTESHVMETFNERRSLI